MPDKTRFTLFIPFSSVVSHGSATPRMVQIGFGSFDTLFHRFFPQRRRRDPKWTEGQSLIQPFFLSPILPFCFKGAGV